MDQPKTNLPRLPSQGDVMLTRIHHHVTAILSHGQGKAFKFTWTNKFPCDTNITMNCLLKVFEDLPESNCPFWWQDIYPRRCGLAVFSGAHPNCQQGHQNPGLFSCGNPAVLPSGTNDDIPGKHFGLQEPYLGILSRVVRPQIKSPTSLNSNWWRSGSGYSTKIGQTNGQSTSVST